MQFYYTIFVLNSLVDKFLGRNNEYACDRFCITILYPMDESSHRDALQDFFLSHIFHKEIFG